ncbi:ABC transporter substrate-binding protein [Moraxella oblonga]|uniref:ABC transporter substrate-binding protein n=1 Tax=Moraxella oblonga TaxID=200413 RepID=UPI00082BD6F5|nr:transporter substrate-binding domain-containing protein [Moraxella oblonga]
MFKKMSVLSMALSALLVLSACQPQQTNDQSADSTTNQETPKQEAPKADEKLETYIALTDPTYPPFESKNEDGTIGGMEIDIFNAIAKDQGFNVNYTAHAWEGIFESLSNPDVALIVSAVGATPEAKAEALLSTPYYFTPYRLLTMDKAKMTDWEKLPKIAVSEDEDGFEDVPRFGVKTEQLVTYPTVFLAVTALIRGEVDAVVADSTVLQYNMNNELFAEHKEKFASKTLPATDGAKLVFAVDKTRPELLEKVNKGLANIKASGELEKILRRYGQDPSLTTMPQ